MTRTLLLILILLLEISYQVYARCPRQFTTAEGLSTNTVYSIEQDNRGVIWIGSVDILAREIGISRTGLFTKIKAVCGMTPNGFIKFIRLRNATALLARPDARVNEVGIDVGFSSRSHFAKSFHNQYRVSPTAYRASFSE